MARHESERHRQQRELREALQSIIRAFDMDMNPGGWMTRMDKEIAGAKQILAQHAQCESGLFEAERQLDFADRRDLKR